MNQKIQQLTSGIDPYGNITPGILIAAITTIVLVACAFALLRLTEVKSQNN